MATAAASLSRSARRETLHRVGTYTLRRVGILLGTVVIGTYLAVLIANWGGEVDKIREAQIRETVGMMMQTDPAIRLLSREEREHRFQEEIARLKRLERLDQPFFERSLQYLLDALTL